MLAQFVTAFDDIVIKRYNAQRQAQDKIAVRYVYSPKQAVLYDIINPEKNLTLPAVAVTIGGIARDNNRVFNKIDGFYYNGGSSTAFVKPPVPINITINMSIIARYQNDMDQILSNFIPYSNPYVIISWPVPKEFQLPNLQEIRSEVLWDGSVSMEYPTDLNGSTKARITADTTFTIKGWLFKDNSNQGPISNIYYIDTNVYAENIISNYYELSGNTYTYPPSTGLYSDKDSFELSASPSITNVFYNGMLLDNNYALTPGVTGNVTLYGKSLSYTEGVLLSSNNPSSFTYNATLTTIYNFPRQQPITGQIIKNYTIVNDNILVLNFPVTTQNSRKPNSAFVLVPYNIAGYGTTNYTYTSYGSALSTNNTLFYIGNAP